MFFSKKSLAPTWIIAGLGNPGDKYAKTRHNMGFITADLLAEQKEVKLSKLSFKSAFNLIDFGGTRCILMKPQTFMNLSGDAIRDAAQFYKIPASHVLVIYDDVSLPVGKIRVRPSGSAGGHNGIKSIIAQLGTDVFPRVKIGTGSPADPEHDMISWVIGEPSQSEKKLLVDAFNQAISAAECIVENDGDCQKAMNQFN
ncbi:MAG: aminoacyl-tRNA hydrolase [Oscillibacter sp.]|jgi:PTH1 family peptidyl-tRNA hydrolase|nr:aminoacyl-tRNA hydrolase [Oscillibacter sp.]